MTMSISRSLRVLAVFAGLGLGGLATQEGVRLEVSHRARAVQPGEVVLLSVESPVPLESVTATAFLRAVSFYPVSDDRTWQGLVGIDLETAAGRHDVVIRARTAGGEVEALHVLPVAAKTFPTRELRVDPKFVTPPSDEMARIQKESRRVRAIYAAASAERFWDGAFERPVPGRSTSSFGRRSVLNGQPRNPHAGADFRAATGTPIRAPNAGRVVLSDDLYFSGNTVILDHGLGLYSYLAHLSKRLVEEGEAVTIGQVVGHAGATGRVTGPHLHWSVVLNGARVDPLSLMAALEETSR